MPSFVEIFSLSAKIASREIDGNGQWTADGRTNGRTDGQPQNIMLSA